MVKFSSPSPKTHGLQAVEQQHTTNNYSGLEDIEIIHHPINGTISTMIAMEKEKNKVLSMKTNRIVQEIFLHPVKYCKDTKSILLSLMATLSDN